MHAPAPDDPLPPLEGPDGAPPEEARVVRWVLGLGGEALVTGRNFTERHLVRREEDLPRGLTSILGLRLPRRDPRVDRMLAMLADSGRCGALTHLDLRDTAIGTEGLRQAVRFAFLERVDLSDTEVTREQVLVLRELADLRAVGLEGTELAHLDFGDLFGQREVEAALRHPLATAQRGLARALDLALAGSLLAHLGPRLGDPVGRLVLALGGPARGAVETPLGSVLRWSASGCLAVLFLVVLETLCVPLLRATPGKALLRVRVVAADGGRTPAPRALVRAATLALRGLGLGVPPLSWVLALWSGSRLWRGVLAPWDRVARTRVVPGACAPWRTLLALVALVLLVVLRPEAGS